MISKWDRVKYRPSLISFSIRLFRLISWFNSCDREVYTSSGCVHHSSNAYSQIEIYQNILVAKYFSMRSSLRYDNIWPSILPKYFLRSGEYQCYHIAQNLSNICIALGRLEEGKWKFYYDMGFSYLTFSQILISWRIWIWRKHHNCMKVKIVKFAFFILTIIIVRLGVRYMADDICPSILYILDGRGCMWPVVNASIVNWSWREGVVVMIRFKLSSARINLTSFLIII